MRHRQCQWGATNRIAEGKSQRDAAVRARTFRLGARKKERPAVSIPWGKCLIPFDEWVPGAVKQRQYAQHFGSNLGEYWSPRPHIVKFR
jgi:hypothetical protein